MIEKFKCLLTKYVDIIINKNNKISISLSDKELSDISLTLLDCIEKLDIDSVNKNQIFLYCSQLISNYYTDKRIYYYSSFYYFYKIAKSKDYEKISNEIYHCNELINYFRIATIISTVPLNSSVDKYFFTRGCRFPWSINSINNDLIIPFTYLLLNYYQTLSLYIDKFNADEYNNIKEKYLEGFRKLKNNNYIINNPVLVGFWNSILPELKIADNFKINSFGETEKRFLKSKLTYDNSTNANLIEDNINKIGETIYDFQLVIEYLNKFNKNLKIDYIEFHNFLELPLSFDITHFVKNYNKSMEIQISGDDLNLLYSYNDETLRNKIAEFIMNVDMTILNKEKSKPHSGYEISDMDLQFCSSNNLYYLCIPVKSGQEIKGDYVKENFAYQIYKPFGHFGSKCIVMFITAKKIGQPLDAYIKNMSTKLPWKVLLLQNEELCKVLKYNNLLN